MMSQPEQDLLAELDSLHDQLVALTDLHSSRVKLLYSQIDSVHTELKVQHASLVRQLKRLRHRLSSANFPQSLD